MSKSSAGLHQVTTTVDRTVAQSLWVAPGDTKVDQEVAQPRWVAPGDTQDGGAGSQSELVAPYATNSRTGPGTRNVPKEQASDSGGRSHPHRTDRDGRSLRCRCTRTQDRNRVIWYRL